MEALLIEKPRIVLVDGLIDVFEEPCAERQQLILDGHDISPVYGGQQRADELLPSFGRKKLGCLEFRHLHRIFGSRLVNDFEGFGVANCDGAESKYPLILLQKVRSCMTSFIACYFQNL